MLVAHSILLRIHVLTTPYPCFYFGSLAILAAGTPLFLLQV